MAYCATCDGEFFTGKEVFVVGGGFAAAEEAVFLTKYASHVTILIRRDDFSCAKSAADAARNHPKITVLTNTEVEDVTGDSTLRAIRYRNKVTGEVTEHRAAEGSNIGVVVFAGYAPATGLPRGGQAVLPALLVVQLVGTGTRHFPAPLVRRNPPAPPCYGQISDMLADFLRAFQPFCSAHHGKNRATEIQPH